LKHWGKAKVKQNGLTTKNGDASIARLKKLGMKLS